MWDDFLDGPDDWAKSADEERRHPNPMGPSGRRLSQYHSYLRCQDAIWKKSVDYAAAKGLNFVFIDLGEGVEYPSHPELKVPGTWSVEKLQTELKRIRALGMTPYPKLNFSSCHDAWLKEYHRMIATPVYYQVVADVIRDVAEMFDRPKWFHIGYDEEQAVISYNHFFTAVRKGDLWWHDLNYTIDQVIKRGSRPVMWADAMWLGRKEYLRRMSKSVLQSNWCYWHDISEKKRQWNYEVEKSSWGGANSLATFLALEEAGFDQLPCCSNYYEAEATEAVAKICKEYIAPERLLGYYTAPWQMSLPDTPEHKRISATLAGIDQLVAAREKTWN